jgi:hypothetical protein
MPDGVPRSAPDGRATRTVRNDKIDMARERAFLKLKIVCMHESADTRQRPEESPCTRRSGAMSTATESSSKGKDVKKE